MKRRRLAWFLGVPAGLFAAIQLVPVTRDNPPVTSPIDAPPEVVTVLKRCCWDCHSNATRWPWYAYVAPASWLVASDVEEARDKMNFSTWGEIPPVDQAALERKAAKEVQKGEMPPLQYVLVHRRARPTAADREILSAWAGRGRTAHD